ncbi:MAG: methylmalonyl-CoA epimerase [Candidatus Promineifilaceae bacterium]|nr:methylmalonyl-CoA epimerase [Candidatus Promineifilaceae bacterium]
MIKINHIAIVVPDLESAQQFWVETLGLPLERVAEVPEEAVRVAFLPAGDAEIELLQPTDDESGVARFMDKRGPGIHHLCLEVDDIEATMARLREGEVELINEIPRMTGDGKKYAFIHPRSTGGVLIELYELTGTPEPAHT